MASEVDRREHAGQLEGIDTVDYADVEEAVVHLGAGGDLHASAVGGSVGEGGEEGGLGFFYFPARRFAGAIPVLLWRVRKNSRSLHCASHSLRAWEAPVGMTVIGGVGGRGGVGLGWRENVHGERGELEHGWRESERVAAVSAKPAWEAVGAAGYFGVESDAGYAAKVPSS